MYLVNKSNFEIGQNDMFQSLQDSGLYTLIFPNSSFANFHK
jgi:hypothetical protein